MYPIGLLWDCALLNYGKLKGSYFLLNLYNGTYMVLLLSDELTTKVVNETIIFS